MTSINNISAVIFFFFFTLVDSEVFTAGAVEALCSGLGIDKPDIDCSTFDGVSWADIARAIIHHYPVLANYQDIPLRLHEIYHRLLRNSPPELIKMSREAVIAANSLMPTAIVSSSHRVSIEETINRMDISSYINFYAGCEDYENSKPAPDGYLKAAETLNRRARECLVFEDSITGITAARNAGMQVIAITQGSSQVNAVTALADMAIKDYSELGAEFFERVKAPS